MHMTVLSAGMIVYHVQSWCPWKPEEGTKFPGNGVRDGNDLLYVCWELSLSPLKEQ